MKKIEVRDKIKTYFDQDIFCGELGEVAKKIENYIKDHTQYFTGINLKKYHKIVIDSEYGYDNDKEYHLYGYRYQTAEERKAEKIRDQLYKDTITKAEKLTYERLKKKFES